jgi:hypothetical protein
VRHAAALLPPLLEALGDSKSSLRDAARGLLLDCLDCEARAALRCRGARGGAGLAHT